MIQIEVIRRLYNDWLGYSNSLGLNTSEAEKDNRMMFLSNRILNLTTYDDKLDVEFGEMVLETIIHIQNKTTFEYIEDSQNYRKYVLSCNLIKSWLNWDTSIRGAFFDGKITSRYFEYIIGYEKNHIVINKEFMSWFIDFLQNKQR